MDIRQVVEKLNRIRNWVKLSDEREEDIDNAISVLKRVDKKKIAALIAERLTTDDDGMYLMGSVGKDFLAGEIVKYLGGEK